MIEIRDKQILIDGRPRLIMCGEVHYFRLKRQDSALLDAGTQPWAYAGLLIGMAAIRAMDTNEQRTLRPSGTLQEANGPRDEAKKNESQHQ